MTSKNKKKVKSVERAKKKHVATGVQANNQIVKNDNNNHQMVQIIFPSDLEIRKKKKKRGTSSAARKKKKEKDELLALLKQKLQEYDALHAQLQQANIKVPAELGIAVISHGQLKTNEEIQSYINDVQNKIAQLQQLLQQQSAPVGLPMRLGAGIMQLANQPALPASTPLAPAYTPIPAATTSQPAATVDPIQQQLQHMAKEVQDHLKNKGNVIPAPPSGIDPTRPLPPVPQRPLPEVPTTQLSPDVAQYFENTIMKIGDRKVDVLAPKGWYDYYGRYRRYLENVQYDTVQNQLMPGVFHIPLNKANDLLDSRSALLKDYENWYAGLKPDVRTIVEKSPSLNTVRQLHDELRKHLSTDIPALAKEILQARQIVVKEITMGNTDPKIAVRIQSGGEAPYIKASDNEAYKKYNDEYTTSLDELYKINKTISKGNLTEAQIVAQDKKINDLETKLFNIYQNTPANVKLAVTVHNDKLNARFNEVRESLSKVIPQERVVQMTEQKAADIIAAYLEQKQHNKEPPAYSNDVKSAVIKLYGEDYEKTLPKPIGDKAESIFTRETQRLQDLHLGSEEDFAAYTNAHETIETYIDNAITGKRPTYSQPIQEAVKLMFGPRFVRSVGEAKTAKDKAQLLQNKLDALTKKPAQVKQHKQRMQVSAE